jgi:glutaredoxin
MGPEDIKVYTVSNCGRCQAVKDFLRAAGEPFTEVVVEGNFSALREMVRLSGSRTVPVTVRDDKIVVGNDPDALRRLIGKETHG